jgi:hypothetical protein
MAVMKSKPPKQEVGALPGIRAGNALEHEFLALHCAEGRGDERKMIIAAPLPGVLFPAEPCFLNHVLRLGSEPLLPSVRFRLLVGNQKMGYSVECLDGTNCFCKGNNDG